MPKDISSRFPEFEKFITFGTYYPVNSGISDNLSESLLNFKRGDANTIQKWADYVKSLIITSNHFNIKKSTHFCFINSYIAEFEILSIIIH